MNKNNLFISNLSWIVFGNIIHAIFSFVLNIYVARSLSQYDYGVINYSTSLIAFASAFCALGLNAVITKQFADHTNESGYYIKTGFILRITVAIISVAALQLVLFFSKEGQFVKTIVFLQSLGVVFSSFDLLVYWFRFEHRAKVEAIARFVAFFLSALWKIIVLMTTKNLYLYTIGVIAETVAFAALLVIIYVREKPSYFLFSKSKAKEMLSISYPFIFSAILITIYAQTDKIMLNSMLSKEAVAQYSVAITLAGAISIIPTSLIEGFRPEIMRFKSTNHELYVRRLSQLYFLVFWICIVYCVLISIFSKPIVLLLYGEKYLDAVNALSLIVWYTSFSYFGAINNIYMVAENKTKWVQVLTLIGSCCNVVLNLILIPIWGIKGAALASLITQFVTNFVLLGIIPSLRDNFKIIVKSFVLNNSFGISRG